MTVRFPRVRTKRHSAGNGFSRFETELKAEIEKQGIIGSEKTEKIHYSMKKSYVPDFQLPNGIIIEAKGYFPREDRAKMAAVKASNPHLDIRLIFLKPNSTIDKKAKMTYSEWAEKYGFPWAARHIPIEWLYEKAKKTV